MLFFFRNASKTDTLNDTLNLDHLHSGPKRYFLFLFVAFALAHSFCDLLESLLKSRAHTCVRVFVCERACLCVCVCVCVCVLRVYVFIAVKKIYEWKMHSIHYDVTVPGVPCTGFCLFVLSRFAEQRAPAQSHRKPQRSFFRVRGM